MRMRSSMRLTDNESREGGDEIRWISEDLRLRQRPMADDP
jgi:hypothetical protein